VSCSNESEHTVYLEKFLSSVSLKFVIGQSCQSVTKPASGARTVRRTGIQANTGTADKLYRTAPKFQKVHCIERKEFVHIITNQL